LGQELIISVLGVLEFILPINSVIVLALELEFVEVDFIFHVFLVLEGHLKFFLGRPFLFSSLEGLGFESLLLSSLLLGEEFLFLLSHHFELHGQVSDDCRSVVLSHLGVHMSEGLDHGVVAEVYLFLFFV
jgi:hypothetical protein